MARMYLMSILFVAAFFLYYLSRFHKKLNLSILLFSLAANILFVINFYFNSGINGPGLMLFLIIPLKSLLTRSTFGLDQQ